MTSNNFELVFSIQRNDKSYSRQLSDTKFALNCHLNQPVIFSETTVFVNSILSNYTSKYGQSYAIDNIKNETEENFGFILPVKLSFGEKNLSEKTFASEQPSYESPSIFWYVNQDVRNSLL